MPLGHVIGAIGSCHQCHRVMSLVVPDEYVIKTCPLLPQLKLGNGACFNIGPLQGEHVNFLSLRNIACSLNCIITLSQTSPDSLVGRVSTLGNGRSQV